MFFEVEVGGYVMGCYDEVCIIGKALFWVYF